MTPILLDTYLLLWAAAGNEQISDEILAAYPGPITLVV